MEYFTVLGITISCIIVLVLIYSIFILIFNLDDEVLVGYISFLIIISILSMLFAMFLVDPTSYGYQKINNVSDNSIEISQ